MKEKQIEKDKIYQPPKESKNISDNEGEQNISIKDTLANIKKNSLKRKRSEIDQNLEDYVIHKKKKTN